MHEMSENGQSGIIIRDKYKPNQWRVYFQGQLTAPHFESRCDAMGYLSALRTGAKRPQYAGAHEGKEEK
jgi:hypothetical protein